jgi:hypothetical protein
MNTTSTLIRAPQPRIGRVGDPGVDAQHRVGSSVAELLAVLRRLHPNILIVGSAVEAERALEQIRPTLLTPMASWGATGTQHLPAPVFRTLIVRDVDGLDAAQQANLALLLRRSAGELQIVSIARQPLFPLVTQGLFLDELYYRLNVVVLEPSRHGLPDW